MKVVKGDLIKLGLNGTFDVIIHGCNCQCVMGKGIAENIKRNFPEAFREDKNTAKGDITKLGTYSYAPIVSVGHKLIVINAYTQFDYRGKKVHADYKAIKSVFEKIKEDFTGKRIGYPKIGAGLAGGDWNIISTIIDKKLEGEDHTLVLFEM